MFSRAEAFERNRGLISAEEQERLARSSIAIAGCGGVGGLHAHTLARLGIGRFRIADADTFSLPNFNRQVGATVETLGKNKAEVTAQMIRSINPEANVEVIDGNITAKNVDDFLHSVDLALDGLDFFAMPVRRCLFGAAGRAAIPALTAAPLGFSATLHVFAPGGMSFDEYFDLNDQQPLFDQLVRFFVGLAPAGLHLSYMDLAAIDIKTGRGPSTVIGTQVAAALAGTEATKVLLQRGMRHVAPSYLQFDCYRHVLRKRRLRGGNRNWLQRLRLAIVTKKLRSLGIDRTLENRCN